MHSFTRGSLSIAALLVSVVASCGGDGGGAGGSGNVVIGVAGPLELVYGRSMRQAAEMAA